MRFTYLFSMLAPVLLLSGNIGATATPDAGGCVAMTLDNVIGESVKALLPGPARLQPEQDAAISEPSVALQWYLFDGANLFRVQASFEPTFDTLFLDDVARHHYYVLHDLPQDNRPVYWRVRACNERVRDGSSEPVDITCVSEWSATFSFVSVSSPDRIPTTDDAPGLTERLFGCDRNSEKPGGHATFLRNFLLIGTAMPLNRQGKP